MAKLRDYIPSLSFWKNYSEPLRSRSKRHSFLSTIKSKIATKVACSSYGIVPIFTNVYLLDVVEPTNTYIIKTVSKRISLYKWTLYDHSWPFVCHMCEYLSQNWGSDGHFEVLNRSYLCLVQNLWYKTLIFPFLPFL